MYKELVHIYGPFSIHSYGLCIAIGLYLILWLMQQHPAFKRLKIESHFASLILVGVLSGLLGGRILYAISSPTEIGSIFDFFAYWHGGFSVLGCVIALCITLPAWLAYCRIPILPFLDLLALYAPLLQSISRIGCLCAGCCYGLPTSVPWSIIYKDPNSIAPLHIYLHPTQLYSSALLLGTFFLMYYFFQHILKRPGQLLAVYLFLSSTERFIVDFWRADRIFFCSDFQSTLSIHQWVALGLMAGATLLMYIISCQPRSNAKRG